MAIQVVKNDERAPSQTVMIKESTKNEHYATEISDMSISSRDSSCSDLESLVDISNRDEYISSSTKVIDGDSNHGRSGDSVGGSGVVSTTAGSGGSSGNKIVLSSTVKFLLLSALAVQGAAYLLLARYTRSVPPTVGRGIMYDIHDLVLMSEVIKFVICCMAESWSTGDIVASLTKNVWNRPLDALKAAVPAVIYVVQNSLTYVALSNLSAPLYVAMIQGKIFVTACVSVALLQRVYRTRQWLCLAMLTFGLVMILMEQEMNHRKQAVEDELLEEAEEDGEAGVLGMEEGESALATGEATSSGGSLWVGSMAVLAASLCSAFASVYMEKVMKKDDGASLYMRNIQLAFFGIIVASTQSAAAYHRLNNALVEEAINNDGEEGFVVEPIRFLHGFTIAVWLTCSLQALGGLLIATIMKYLDSVMKGLAIAVSVVLITVVSWLFVGGEDDVMTPTFVAGAVVILTSVYFFSNPIPSSPGRACGC